MGVWVRVGGGSGGGLVGGSGEGLRGWQGGAQAGGYGAAQGTKGNMRKCLLELYRVIHTTD